MTPTVACVSPIVVQLPSKLLAEVACGQCRGCRLKRKRAWVGRLLCEFHKNPASRFITLTYADDPGTLQYRDFQLFMKSYRKENGDARFFVVGEYGGKNGRGHYHAILFGQPAERVGYSLSLSKVWKRGYCYDGTVTKASIAYVAGYCFKENYCEGKMPFMRASLKPGIGLPFITELGKATSSIHLAEWPKNYRIDGKYYPLHQGGLVAFQNAYLENGGLPPPISNPIERDFAARNRHHPEYGRGLLVFEEQLRAKALQARYTDASAIKKAR